MCLLLECEERDADDFDYDVAVGWDDVGWLLPR